MRIVQFIVFFGVFFFIYFIVNYYIFAKGLRTFNAGSNLRLYYSIGFWSLASSYFLGRILEKVHLSYASDFFTWAGSFWLAAMLYLFLIVLLFDILRAINHFIPFFASLSHFTVFAKPYYATVIVAFSVFLLILAGHINAISPRIKELNINIEKYVPNKKSLRLVMVSDIHLGTIVGPKRVTKLVRKINELSPEAVLLAGDIVDEDLAPVINQNLGSILATINAPLGVFGSTGNHEYIGGAEEAVNYLQQFNINMLRDTTVQLIENIYVSGREDIESMRFGGKKRSALAKILGEKTQDNIYIVLDHQPRAITEAISAGADLVVSGHTHDGQLWPLNYITNAIFKLGYGYKQFENTHVYVSNGYGSWGPPVRIGKRPEIIHITLNFVGKNPAE